MKTRRWELKSHVDGWGDFTFLFNSTASNISDAYDALEEALQQVAMDSPNGRIQWQNGNGLEHPHASELIEAESMIDNLCQSTMSDACPKAYHTFRRAISQLQKELEALNIHGHWGSSPTLSCMSVELGEIQCTEQPYSFRRENPDNLSLESLIISADLLHGLSYDAPQHQTPRRESADGS